MPRYYFELEENGRRYPDDEGDTLEGPDLAREEAARVLAEVARDKFNGNEGHNELVMLVLDEARHPLTRLSMVFDAREIS